MKIREYCEIDISLQRVKTRFLSFQPHRPAFKPQLDGSAFPPRFDLQPDGDL